MRIDLNRLSVRDLETLIIRAQTRLGELAAARRARVRKQIVNLVAREKLTLEEVYGVRPIRRRPTGGYRNPDAPRVVWSGRGRAPRWFHAALARGVSRQDMAR